MADLGGYTVAKKYYPTVPTLSAVPDGLLDGDLVLVGGATGHAQAGVYAVRAGAWEKLTTNTATKYHVLVDEGSPSIVEGAHTLFCSDLSAARYKVVRGFTG